jgi:hypothetical protein
MQPAAKPGKAVSPDKVNVVITIKQESSSRLSKFRFGMGLLALIPAKIA